MPDTPDNNIVIALLRTIDTKIDRAVDGGEAERRRFEIALMARSRRRRPT